MNLFARQGGPARIFWRLPSGTVPGWVEQTVALLNRGVDVECHIQVAGLQPPQRPADALLRSPPTGASAGLVRTLVIDWDDVPLAARSDAASGSAAVTAVWLVTDGHGDPLPNRMPLLDAITAGQGIELMLWEFSPQGDLRVTTAAGLAAAAGAGVRCVRRLHVRASPRYGHGVERLAPALSKLLLQACRDGQLQVPHLSSSAGMPRPHGVAPRPARTAAGNALRLLRGAFKAWAQQQQSRWTRERWLIGVVDMPVRELLGANKRPSVRWLQPPEGLGYWADPMGHGQREHEIVCEYFDELTGLGHIEVLAVDERCRVQTRQRLPIGAGGHASFPLVVNIDGRQLGMAETSSQRECVLHEIDAQGRWHPIATLLRGMAVADPALFSWGGRYWLAYTDIDRGETDNLCLQYAHKLEGPWQPHANNPVKLDVTSSRMAGGFFVHEGALYRPAQNCLTTYGGSVVIHRVLHCSPTLYEEVPVQQLLPDPHSPCPDGLHTLSAWGERTLVDGKQHLFSATLLGLKLWRRLRRLHAGLSTRSAQGHGPESAL